MVGVAVAIRVDGALLGVGLAVAVRVVVEVVGDAVAVRVGVDLLCLSAGSVGLNIAEACHGFFLDEWWNPFVHRQCEDRIHRIGQTQPVAISYLLASFGRRCAVTAAAARWASRARSVWCSNGGGRQDNGSAHNAEINGSVVGGESAVHNEAH